MKKVMLWTAGILLALAALGIAVCPLVSSYMESRETGSEVMGYLDTAQKLTEEEYAHVLEEAEKYNESLVDGVGVGDPFGSTQSESEEYETLLSIDGSPVMAALEIPVIDISLPVYHGTKEEVLQKGTGHLAGSSLPVGGTGTHAVLTGHSGMSSKKLFSDLDKLEEGDVFYIHCLNETLAYQIDQIKVVKPTETDDLRIDPEQDYVTLVTCTPFGINSHRLLVRGTRISYEEAQGLLAGASPRESTWNSEYVKAVLVGIAVMAAILAVFAMCMHLFPLNRKKSKSRKNGQNGKQESG